MKTLTCKTVTGFSPREFSDKSTELVMKMRREGWHIDKLKIDTCEVHGTPEGVSYTGFFIFESDDDET